MISVEGDETDEEKIEVREEKWEVPIATPKTKRTMRTKRCIGCGEVEILSGRELLDLWTEGIPYWFFVDG